jgi:hypothetical protein
VGKPPEQNSGGIFMPFRHTDKGWFWGSKGPFDSKAKALQVAQAAYASGYKEEAIMNYTVEEFALCLLHAVTNGHILHLRADTTGIHLAMGEFYNSIGELADSYIEAYQGRYGKIEQYGSDYEPPVESPIEYVIGFIDYVETARKSLKQDTYLQNITDEIVQSASSTLNKLRFYK